MLTDINERKEMELLLKNPIGSEELSNQDSLTGRTEDVSMQLEHEYYRLRRSNSKLSILLDIDHSKEYNDYYGHVMGDECLRQIEVC